MEFDVLGPVRVHDAAGAVALPPGRAEATMTWLILNVNHSVSLESIAGVLWDQPPDQAATRVRAVLRELERLLGSDHLVTTPRARLVAPQTAVDAWRFEHQIAESAGLRAAGNPGAARQTLRDALALWRGRPYLELDRSLPALGVADRLTAMRLDAIEDLTALELRGRVDYTHVADLQSLVILHPDRMGLRRQLALALYRTDRQVDALDTLRRARADLVDVDGTAARLQDAILHHDPRLALGELPG